MPGREYKSEHNTVLDLKLKTEGRKVYIVNWHIV